MDLMDSKLEVMKRQGYPPNNGESDAVEIDRQVSPGGCKIGDLPTGS